MKRKSSGSITASTVLFVASGLMASVLGLRQYDRMSTDIAWVTSAAMSAGQTIEAQSLTRSRVKQGEVGIDNPGAAIGKRLVVDKGAGQPIRKNDLAAVSRQQARTLAQFIPEGRVVVSLPLPNQSTIPLTQLSGGDRLDVLVRARGGVRTAATDVRLIGISRPRVTGLNAGTDEKITSLLPQRSRDSKSASGKTTLVLAVSPADVYPLAHIGATDSIALVLHSARDVAAGNTISVTPRRAERPVEVVAGLDRSTVFVEGKR